MSENAKSLLEHLARCRDDGSKCVWINVTDLAQDEVNWLWAEMRKLYELLGHHNTPDGKHVIHVSLVPLDTDHFCCGMGELIWNGSADY